MRLFENWEDFNERRSQIEAAVRATYLNPSYNEGDKYKHCGAIQGQESEGHIR